MENISSRILQFNQSRMPDMIHYKYKAMAENLYRFYRGTNHIFYEDIKEFSAIPVTPLSWICGDLHLENFGSYKGDNRLVYFDLNDFDDAVLAPVALELARLLSSVFIAFETLQIEQKKALNMAQLFLRTYSKILSKGKAFYIERQIANGIVADFLKSVSQRKTKDILKKKAVQKNEEWQLLNNAKLITLDKNLKEDIKSFMNNWLKEDENSPYGYEVIDAAFRLAGTGSLGLKRYTLLLKSTNMSSEKYIIAEMKQATAPSPHSHLSIEQPQWETEAHRVISIQKKMQNRSPALLSAAVFRDESFIVDELQPTRDSIDFTLLAKDYRSMCQVIDDMAMLTASAQLRSSGQQGSSITDELVAFGNASNWQEQLINFSIDYSHQLKKNYLHYLADYKAGCFKK